MLIYILADLVHCECQTLEYKSFNNHQEFTSLADNCMIVRHCVFDSCHAQADTAGGALYIFASSNSTLLCENNLFFRCTSEQNAGAIYFAGLTSRYEYCCFSECSANETASIYVETNYYQNYYINFSSFVYNTANYDMIFAFNGELHADGINCSNNVIAEGMSFLHGVQTQQMMMSTSSFYSNSYGSVLSLEEMNQNLWVWIQMSNFYNYTSKDKFMIRLTTSLIMWDSVFQKCGTNLISANKGLAQELIRVYFDVYPFMNSTFIDLYSEIYYNVSKETNYLTFLNTVGCPGNFDSAPLPTPIATSYPYPTRTPTASASQSPYPTMSPTPDATYAPTPIPAPTEKQIYKIALIASTSILGVICLVLIVFIITYFCVRKKFVDTLNSKPLLTEN